MCGVNSIARNDALAKARGEPTRGFHNIQPNYNNPEIIAAVADKKAGRSTKFDDTGVPNIWQQYSGGGTIPVARPAKTTPSRTRMNPAGSTRAPRKAKRGIDK